MNKNWILLCLLISTPILAMEEKKKEPGVEWLTREQVDELKKTISQKEELIQELIRERDHAKKNNNKKKNSTRRLRKKINELQRDLLSKKCNLERDEQELRHISKTESIAGIEIKYIHSEPWFRLSDKCSFVLMYGTLTVITGYIFSYLFPEPNDSYYEAFKKH